MERPGFSYNKFFFYGSPQSKILQSLVSEVKKFKGTMHGIHDHNDRSLDLALQRYKYDVIVLVLDHQSDIDKHIRYNVVGLQDFLDTVERCKRTLWASKLVVVHDVSVCPEITRRMIAVKQFYLPDVSLLSIEYDQFDSNIEAAFKDAVILGHARTICQPHQPVSAENVTDKALSQAPEQAVQMQVQEQVQVQVQEQEESPPQRQESIMD